MSVGILFFASYLALSPAVFQLASEYSTHGAALFILSPQHQAPHAALFYHCMSTWRSCLCILRRHRLDLISTCP